jgi:hypothetical protein
MLTSGRDLNAKKHTLPIITTATPQARADFF